MKRLISTLLGALVLVGTMTMGLQSGSANASERDHRYHHRHHHHRHHWRSWGRNERVPEANSLRRQSW